MRTSALVNVASLAVEGIAGLMPGTRARSLRRDLRDQRRLRNADVAVVSFPKSGRTFLRVMISHLFHQTCGVDQKLLIDFDNFHRISEIIPRVVFTHDGDALRKPEDISVDLTGYAGKKIVHLVRHPADTAISRYYHLRDRSRDHKRRRLARQPLGEFIWTQSGGIPSIVSFLNAWQKAGLIHPQFLTCRYEDLVTEPERSLPALMTVLQVESDQALVNRVIEFSSFSSMQAKERAAYFESGRLGIRRAGIETSAKVRSGRTFGYRNVLTVAEVERIDCFVARQLDPRLGY